ILRRLLGDDSFAWAMTSQVRAAMQGVSLLEDREKLALLEKEKRTDLAAILSTAELEEYEMRSSPQTSRMRTMLTILDASEDEVRAFLKIKQSFNERINPTGISYYSSQIMEERGVAQKQMNEQIQAALSPTRYSEYLRASNPEFQQLYRIAQRENVPAETA